MTVQASARLPTEWAKSWKGRPCASYSRRASGWPGRELAPMPKSSRPPETMSTVAAILASIAGGRKHIVVVDLLRGGHDSESRADPRHDRRHGEDPRRPALPRTDPPDRARRSAPDDRDQPRAAARRRFARAALRAMRS